MTRLIIKKSKLKTNGFLLAEAIFSLVIVILILTILQNILFSIKKINMSENNQVNDLAYAYVQLNNFMHAKDTRTVYPVKDNHDDKSATFTRIDNNKNEETYNIEYYLKKKVLKVSKVGTKSTGGYMPLIFNIRDAKFETKKDKIIIHIDEYNKGKSDLVFQLDEKVDEKEDVKKKKDLKKAKAMSLS